MPAYTLDWILCYLALPYHNLKNALSVLLIDSQPRRAHYFAEQNIVGYTLLNSLNFAPHFPQSFSLRYALKNTLEKTFSTCVQLHFSASFILFYSQFLFLRFHERQIISLSYMDISKPFCGGVSQKFYPLTIIGKLQAACRRTSRKFYKKIAEIFSRQPQIKRKSDITQTSFYVFIKLFLIVQTL